VDDPGNFAGVAGIAAFLAIVTFAAVALAKVLGRWFRSAIVDSVSDGIREITAPDLAALADSVTKSIDELSASIGKAIEELAVINGAQHELVDGRLTVVETRLTDVEHRLMAVEKGMGIRSPESRTRVSDGRVEVKTQPTEGVSNG
jgi:hypothetical protein